MFKNKDKIKRILFYALVVSVSVFLIYSPFASNKAHAKGFLAWLAGGLLPDPGELVLGLIVYGIYYLVFMPCSLLLWFAGQIFNMFAAYTLQPATYSAQMVSIGWGVARDVANLFFIFILLYIAIAFILQLSGYESKKVLVTLIVIALLINFSLIISQTIINGSNLLANEFYDAISATSSGSGVKDVSAVFVKGFNPQKLFSEGQFKTLSASDGNDKTDALLKGVMIMIFASLLILLASFVLLAGAILFLVRVVSLWIIMILGPLAFLAMALPATKKYASEWWTKLFHHSIFAPAFLFFFYLVATMIGDGNFMSAMITQKTVVKGSGILQTFQQALIGMSDIMIKFLVLGGLMVGSLIVAQKLGAAGAATAISVGKRVQKGAQDVAARNTVGRASRAVAESKTMQKAVSTIPALGGLQRLAQRGAKVGGLDKKTEAQIKTATSLPANMQADYFRNASRHVQEGMLKGMNERQRFDMIKEGDKKTPGFKNAYYKPVAERMIATGQLRAEDLEKMDKLEGEQERNTSIKNINENEKGGVIDAKTFENNLKTLQKSKTMTADDIKALADGLKKDPTFFKDPDKINALVNNMNSSQFKNTRDNLGIEQEKGFMEHIAKLGDGIEEVAKKIQNAGNSSLASFIRTAPGMQTTLKSYGMKEPELKEESRIIDPKTGKPFNT